MAAMSLVVSLFLGLPSPAGPGSLSSPGQAFPAPPDVSVMSARRADATLLGLEGDAGTISSCQAEVPGQHVRTAGRSRSDARRRGCGLRVPAGRTRRRRAVPPDFGAEFCEQTVKPGRQSD